MSRFRLRAPSPALVISLVALFVSLGGVSWGVATGFIDSREIKNNEVRSIDIRNNEVRTLDVRNNEVRGIDIRNSTVQGRDIALNTVTGEDVKEDTLQKVPSAMLADSATTATKADAVASLKQIPRTVRDEGAPDVVLLTHGPFTLSARCVANATATQAQLILETTENNTAAVSDDFNTPVFNALDGEQKLADLPDAAGGQRSVYLRNLAAVAPSGKSFTGQMVLIPDAAANNCTFAGHLTLQG